MIPSRFRFSVCYLKTQNITSAEPIHLVLYGYETRSVTLREEQRLRGFEKWVTRKILRLRRRLENTA